MIIQTHTSKDFYRKRKRKWNKAILCIASFVFLITVGSTIYYVSVIRENRGIFTLKAAEKGQEVLINNGGEVTDENQGTTDEVSSSDDLLNIGEQTNNEEQNNIDAANNDLANDDFDNEVQSNPPDQGQEAYDYSKSVKKTEKVDASFFEDAVFLGDSRVEGFMLYSGIKNSTAYTERGLMVDTIFTKAVVKQKDKKVTILEALEKGPKYSKIYLMFGINELGWISDEIFIQRYGELIDKLKEINPNAQIYVQSILPVTKGKVVSNVVQANEKINTYNKLIKKMAEEKQIYYLNIHAALKNSEGNLPDEAAFDGVHLKKPYCEKWYSYLRTHTVSE